MFSAWSLLSWESFARCLSTPQRMDRGRTTLGTVRFKYPSYTTGCNQSAGTTWPEVAAAPGKGNWHLPNSRRVIRPVFWYVVLQETGTFCCALCLLDTFVAFVDHIDSWCPTDELIRQITINCGERGLLLLRVRDDIRMTIAAYQTLYESSIAFGMRKALMAEQRKRNMEARVWITCMIRNRWMAKSARMQLRYRTHFGDLNRDWSVASSYFVICSLFFFGL